MQSYNFCGDKRFFYVGYSENMFNFAEKTIKPMNNTKRFIAAAAVAAVAGLHVIAGNNLTMIVGTYTDQSTSDGMYVYRFNQHSGEARALGGVKAGNPSFLAVGAGGTRVYAVSEYDDGRQGIGAYSLNRADGSLRLIDSRSCGTLATRQGNRMPGAAPCNVMVYGGHVVTSNYNGGDISVFPIAADGGLGAESQYFDMYRDSLGSVSHIHCCRMTPDRRYMLADDLGNDCIWRFDVGSGETFLSSPAVAYSAPKGTGPRHLVFNNKGDRAYLIGELDGTVTVLGYSGGTLRELQRLQASQTRTAGSADIHLSPDGKFLYASHRLKDEGVSVFAVDASSGLLTKVGFQPTAAHPRNFAITPNGRFLLVACRDGNVIEVYRRDQHTGMLVNTGRDIRLGKPVCIQFTGE